MKKRFVDSSFYIAIANSRDEFHDVAMRCLKERRGGLVTTEYVLIETGNWLAATDREVFADLLEMVRADLATQVVDADRELFDAGLELYKARQDKQWSMTDCISFVVMRRENLKEALTTDHHFEQAGFVALLR